MNTFLCFNGGDGGDFVMQMVYWYVHGEKPNVDEFGRQELSKSVENFAVGNHNLIKCHVPWTDKNFLGAKNKRIILLYNPDPVVWNKKRVTKLRDIRYQATGVRSIDKKIVKALKQKDFKTVYALGSSYWVESHKFYRKDIQGTLDKTEHLLLENNMVSVDDVTNTIQFVMQYLDIDNLLSTEMISECEAYAEKQKHIIDTQWDYIV